jgi:hypothetical protein
VSLSSPTPASDVPEIASAPPASDLRRSLFEAGVAVALTIGLVALGTLVLYGPSGGISPLALLVILGWKTLVWIALVAAIAFRYRGRTSGFRAGLFTTAAVVLALLWSVIDALPVLVPYGGGMLLFLIPSALISILGFTVCAALGSFAAIPLAARGRSLAPRLWAVGTALALVVGGALILSMLFQWFQIYFQLFGGPAPTPTPAQEATYLWTAGICLGLLLAALIAAIVRKLRAATIIGSILLVTAVIAAVLFSIPSGRWAVDNDGGYAPDPEHPGVSCFGGDDCPGG